jgi:hypothetical protein
VIGDLKNKGTCGDEQQVYWQFFNYQTTIPSDGEVRFRLRSAEDEAGLATATWIDVKTATASQPECTPWALIPGCPVDLVSTLGDDVNDEFIDLEMTIVPGSDGSSPSLEAWEMTYSCPFFE